MATQTHDVVFSVKQRNIDQIEKILLDVSTPGSTNYGKHMTRAQVADLTANPAATQAIKDYLAANGAEVVKATQYGEYITARANIATWEKLFDTKFYLFKDIYNSKTGPIFRSLEYSIDESLVDHVGAVFGTSQLPTHMNPRSSYRKVSEAALAGTITPAQINSYYNVTSNKGNSLASQAVFETIGQTYSEPDLAMFESQYNIPAEKVAVDIGGFESDTLCQTDVNSCVEANLDVQYLIAVSQVTPTTYW